MIQLTAKDGSVFGPFATIDKLEDRYSCDGQVHLPFTVVGDNCVIGEYVQPPTVVEPPAETPAE